jgi:eukaryotic-like serine/threonine-protein kinase
VVEVFSDRDSGTVTAQQPKSDTVVVEGTRVRINVSKGTRPITVPSLVGVPYEEAVGQLERVGLRATRANESSDLQEGLVTRTDPSGGSEASRGTTVTVYVSRGPDTIAVPDVTATDVTIAQATLEGDGFRFRITYQDTPDLDQDGIVLSQDPLGGSQARPNAIVTLVVGRFVEEETTDEETTTPVP